MDVLHRLDHPSGAPPGLEQAREVWQIADKRLGRNDWAVGGSYSIADIHLFRLYWRFRGALEPKPGDFPNIEAHYAAHDGAAGGQEDHRDRGEDRLLAAALSDGLSSRAKRGTFKEQRRPRFARDDSGGAVSTMERRYAPFITRHTFSGVTGMSTRVTVFRSQQCRAGNHRGVTATVGSLALANWHAAGRRRRLHPPSGGMSSWHRWAMPKRPIGKAGALRQR